MLQLEKQLISKLLKSDVLPANKSQAIFQQSNNFPSIFNNSLLLPYFTLCQIENMSSGKNLF